MSTLRRELGVVGATMLGLGSILGTGVFVSIGLVAGLAGVWTVAAVLAAALVATCNALSSAQLAAAFPRSGGTYEYGYRLLHPFAGFTAGWMFLCAKSASAATAALGFAGYLLHTLEWNTRWLVPIAIRLFSKNGAARQVSLLLGGLEQAIDVDEDTVAYKRHLDDALLAFEASLKVAPWNQQALDFYPLLLVQAYRDDEARAFLASLADNVSAQEEERVVANAMRGFLRGGVPELAVSYLSERIAAQPGRKFYYMMEFMVYQALGARNEARSVMEAWERQSGERDPEMVRALQEMQAEAERREQQRIEDALEGQDDK